MKTLSNELLTNKFKFYRAKVVDNKDPQKWYRVRVWIPDIMYDFDESQGIWALPVCLSGGNIDQHDGSKHSGSIIIPRIGDWIIIFFENDNINRPYYLAGLSLEKQPKIPESQIGTDYQKKYVLFRSPQGRSIWISDDDTTPDSRVMITGKKRQYDPNNPLDSVLPIVDNQSVISIEEDDKERILLADYNKDYISIRTDKNKIYIYASSIPNNGSIDIFNDKTLIRLQDDGNDGRIVIQNSKCKVTIENDNIDIDTPNNLSITSNNSEVKISPNNIKLQTSGALFELNGNNIVIYASGTITVQGTLIQENPGSSYNPDPDSLKPLDDLDEDEVL